MGHDPVEKDRNSKEYYQRIGAAVVELGRACEGYRDLSMQVIGMSIRAPQFRDGEYLMVVRGLGQDGGMFVAFHSALDIGEVLRGVDARLRNGSLKWRVDEYAGK